MSPTKAPIAATASPEGEGLERKLAPRHIQMIALGGAIGVGLFLGSGEGIADAGPGLLLAYVLGGAVIFLMLRGLGELAMHEPVAGSFTHYARDYVGPLAGFFTGWTYWMGWLVTGMAELTAAGIYVNFWIDVPQWAPALAFLVLLYVANLISVRLFGEFEFWFALVKVVTIIGMILLGLAVILFGFGPLGDSASFANLWDKGGLFPNGFVEVLIALQIVMFAFFGVELVGVTAGEAQDPERVLPSAINRVIVRILIFYIGALAVLMSLLAWDRFDAGTSPFVLAFEEIGIPAAAGIVNFVVLTAALSSCNSGLFSTGRMMLTLARAGQAPARLGRLSDRRVPANAMSLSVVVLLIGVIVNLLIPDKAFAYITSVATIAALWTWGMIAWTHLRFRRHAARNAIALPRFRMPGSPVTNWLVIGFMAAVAVLLLFDADTRVAWYVAPIWSAALLCGWLVVRRRGRRSSPLAPEPALTD